MRVPEEWILPISFVRKRHPISQLADFCFIHTRQNLLILPVQTIIVPSQDHDHKAQSTQCCDDADFTRDITRCFFLLKRLRAEDVTYSERHQSHGVDGYFFGVAADISV
jgi:hypothetical protein